MKIRVLGCSGAELPGHRPSAFLVDDSLLLDAGTVGAVLTGREQEALQWVLVTHAHLDHVRGIPLWADNLIVANAGNSIQVMGRTETLDAIRDHIMNDVIWPDFSRIPSLEEAVVRYRPLELEREYRVDGYEVTAYGVNHSIPAVAYRVRREGVSILYTGDTGPTERVWQAAGKLDALIIEVSFPDEMEGLAIQTGHLTPRLLKGELGKLPIPPRRILITHLKPQHDRVIREQLAAAGVGDVEFLKDGACYEILAGRE
jgi:ribonuclease BN (tRNA processing enzyme)